MGDGNNLMPRIKITKVNSDVIAASCQLLLICFEKVICQGYASVCPSIKERSDFPIGGAMQFCCSSSFENNSSSSEPKALSLSTKGLKGSEGLCVFLDIKLNPKIST